MHQKEMLMSDVIHGSDGNLYYVIGASATDQMKFLDRTLYSSGGELFLNARGTRLNLVGKEVYVNGVDISAFASTDLSGYAKLTDVRAALDARFALVLPSDKFKVNSDGSLYSSKFNQMKRVPNASKLRTLASRLNEALGNMGTPMKQDPLTNEYDNSAIEVIDLESDWSEDTIVRKLNEVIEKVNAIL